MDKYKFIGYEHCSIILKATKYPLTEPVIGSLPGRGFILAGLISHRDTRCQQMNSNVVNGVVGKKAQGEFERASPGYGGAQDTSYAGLLRGRGGLIIRGGNTRSQW